MKTKCKIAFLFVCLMSSCNLVFAGEYFSVSSNGTSVTVQSLIANHTYSNAAIKLNSTDYTFTDSASDCTSFQNGYCLFSVSDTTSKTIQISGKEGLAQMVICLSAASNTPQICQRYTMSISPISNKLVYVSSAYGLGLNILKKCQLGATGETLANCTSTGSDFNNPYDMVMHPKRLSLYVTNSFDPSLSQCFLDASGDVTTCNKFTSNLHRPLGITINSAGTLLYMTSGDDDNVTKCSIKSDGSIIGCGQSGDEMSIPVGIVLNNAGTLAYVSNYKTNTITMCSIDSTGDLSSCQTTGSTLYASGLSSPTGLAIDPKNKYLYALNDAASTATKCLIGALGTLTNCTATGSGFSNPQKMRINKEGTRVFVSNSESQQLRMCEIGPSGDWTNCSSILSSQAGLSALELIE
jgi:DNA-binding beta-propeller fold protein YncE